MNSKPVDVKLIFAEALDRTDVQERAAYLDGVCGSDVGLREEVESLLTSYEQADGFLPSPDLDQKITLDSPAMIEGPGTVIGRYKLLEKIGEGGMAVVYMAEQTEPIRRKVALKIIRLGMDTKSIIARFEAERQALAMMDHPNIAKVFDAGATETGRPYFVMELVTGVSITKYCDKNRLSIKEKLKLFITVCDAVQHAHQNGIIHRDIKPSNILVTMHSGKSVPKVIDFGIAKATNQKLTEKTLFTRYAHIIGTPAYMSPEQVELSDVEIDTRTDIYSLGVLLYELLTRTTPFSEEKLREAGYLQMQKIICEEEPTKPSTKLSTLGEALTDVAEWHNCSPESLPKLIRGDLDWIVMKAIDKDRTRRYETANDLALDIERHLHYEPISAGPPSTAYRLHKFVRRNRVAVITFSLVAAALAIGATAATIAVWSSSVLPGKVEHAAGMVQRHVWNVPPKSDLTGGISPDGRYLSYVDWTAGNLAVYDLVADANWLVTNNTDSTWKNIDGWAESSTISPDSKQIAYSWYNQKGLKFYDLRMIGLDGANLRVLYHDAAVFWIKPCAWSPDGRNILAYFSDANKNLVDEKTGELFRKGYLVMVSVTDSSVRTLKTWQSRGSPRAAVFSPDGRYIAYDFEQKDDVTRYDIFLMDLDGGGEISLIEHPADDQLLGWTLDGRRVVFASDRSARRGLWMIEVTDGVTQGSPRPLMDQFYGRPMGFTADGSFYYGVPSTASNVYVARLDPAGVEFVGEPELVSSQFVGSTTMGDFSPDGRFLAYRTGRAGQRAGGNGPGDWVFVINSVETSQERIISPVKLFRADSRMRGPRWSPDGQSLLVCGTGQEGGHSLYTVDAETGISELITPAPDGLTHAVWSPDGTSIYARSVRKLSRLDLATGRQTTLYKGLTWGPWNFDVSPDGQWLAFYPTEDSLAVMPSAGGELREVIHFDRVAQQNPPFVRWTPDGEHLLFGKRKSELWKVNIETGAQQQIGPVTKNLVDVSMHPDGRQIAFTVEQYGTELWVMENFLPD